MPNQTLCLIWEKLELPHKITSSKFPSLSQGSGMCKHCSEVCITGKGDKVTMVTNLTSGTFLH